MSDSSSTDRLQFNRAAFLAGSLAAMSLPLTQRAAAAAPAASPTGALPSPERLLRTLMAGNERFVHNDFPALSKLAEKRQLLIDTQTPFAAILGCADSRVIPNMIFVEGLGDLFVARVAGNYPDDLVIASLEYAIEHLGTRLIVVLGHQNCGAIHAVYEAIETKKPLPPHLSTIQDLIAPGISRVVQSRGPIAAAVEANVHAACSALRTNSPTLASRIKSGDVLIAGGVYQLGSGAVKLVE